ncbi:alpha/beta hydrolase [Streptomyces sp. NPDC086080]|uniref:alpha/beta hydrolase n=1 Tax=Streptomyces sp. NPDC086080 TaxID=3365748 RepID=UPI0037D41848
MSQYTDHRGPRGLRTRGTVVVVPGRGETRATYTRLGRRLAADAYRVRVIDGPHLATDASAEDPLPRLAARIAAAIEGTAPDGGVARPVVLIGADTGAAAIATLLGRSDLAAPAARPDAVVLAGLPAPGATVAGTWEEELDVRTACPAHRGTLTEDAEVGRGALNNAVPEAAVSAVYAGDVPVPALLLAGDADPLTDRDALARAAKAVPRARLSVVRGARHDVLNDVQHRSVAAEIVTFLETLRNELVPLVTVESSAW